MKKLIGFYNPYCLLPHCLKNKKNNIFFNSFFLSFGDALGGLINKYNLKSNQIALLPNFYCPETAEMISKKLKTIFYEINHDFSPNKESYFEQIKNYSPDLIINYSFTGFTLEESEKERLKSLTKDSVIIIDDCAHQFPKKDFQKIKPGHFMIDSTRKHSPFLGSHIFGLEKKSKIFKAQRFNSYKFKCLFYQWLKNCFDLLCVVTNISFFNELSDKIFLAQDNIIGDNPKPTKGCLITFWLYNTVDWKKIEEHKKNLAVLFSQELFALNLPGIKSLPPETAKNANVNYLPIFVDKIKRDTLLDYLNDKEIFVDILWETESSSPKPLSNQTLYDSFIIYPLTWLIKEKDIFMLIELLKDFSKKNEK